MTKTIKLLDYAKKELEALGFKKVDNNRYDYYKETSYGKIGITPRTATAKTGINLLGMFYDVEKAKTKFPCNPFSGKYNFLFLKSKFEISNALCQYLK
jgi:hypothetical protein